MMQTPNREELLQQIADISTSEAFERLALDVFRYQAINNAVYKEFIRLLGRHPADVNSLAEIPALPIQLFKHYEIKSGIWTSQTHFTSSGTTGQSVSRHPVRDMQWYLDNALRGFELQYGSLSGWRILALLPSYLERQGSSLVAMADAFIRRSGHPESGFFLHDFDALYTALLRARDNGGPTLLLGVSFALLDLAERYPMPLSPDTVIMETGGMKGRRHELTREELHLVLKEAFQLPAIHSEYGMTELFSQAYSIEAPYFQPAPTLRLSAAEVYDPLAEQPFGKTGQLKAIDLANLDTCSFIATEDLGRILPDGRFEVLGRLDAAELRGCNLLIE